MSGLIQIEDVFYLGKNAGNLVNSDKCLHVYVKLRFKKVNR